MNILRVVVLFFWNLVYPVVVVLAFPFWLLKMIRRDGWGSGLSERLGFYNRNAEAEKLGGVYIHAVSVGEILLALKMIEKWREMTDDHFVLVPTTATGMAVARERAGDRVRVIYAPLDFGFLIRRVIRRFEPRMVVMVESELWPNLLWQPHRLGIPLGLINARLSPRSGRRYAKARPLVAPFLSLLDAVGVPEEGDLLRWQTIGVRSAATEWTGNVKFDPEGAAMPKRRTEFTEMLEAFPKANGLVAMGVSTFSGEEFYLDEVFREAGYQSVLVPRHAERRDEIVKDLDNNVVLRSRFQKPSGAETFVIDSTGELRDWTAHADVVVIGKSIFEKGGQNPSEAILAGVPVICGPFMANFEPLVSELKAVNGLQTVETREELLEALKDLDKISVKAAREVLEKHRGAMEKTIQLFLRLKK